MTIAAVLPVFGWLTSSVAERVAAADPKVGLSRFVNYPACFRGVGLSLPRSALNPRFWAVGVDFSCASPWNDSTGALRAGTLISRRHIVFARHFPFWKGVRISFVDNEGLVCPLRVAATKAIEGVDIMIASLDYEVTPNIRPAKILPPDYEKFIGNGAGLPVVTFNQREELVITELKGIPTNRLMRIKAAIPIPEHMHTRIVESGPMAGFKRLLVDGDSGSPAFLVAGNEPILLYCDCSNNASSGPPLHLYRREIQKAMDDLCPGYTLEAFDFATSPGNVH